MKIAILHEMLVKMGGAEKVLEKFMKIFPEADLYTLIYDEKKVGKVFPKAITPHGTQFVYNLTKKQRLCLPFMPKAVESLDFSDYDVVLCSSSGFAHGAITKPETRFIVYYHSPARYLWDWTNEYKRDIGWNKGLKGYTLNSILLKLRKWDFVASNRVDIRIANSKNTASRIQKYYKKDSVIIFPPVETTRFSQKIDENISKEIFQKIFSSGEKKDYFIIVSALTEFKKIELAIEGFNKIKDKNLIIVGDGDYKDKLKSLVKGKNIYFYGKAFGDELVALVQNSLGLIFPGEEDFGISPIEAMAAGKPVFAYRGGGLLESVEENKTGNFFDDKNGYDFVPKFNKYYAKIKAGDFDEKYIKKHAKQFDESVFEEKIRELVLGKNN